MRAAEAGRCRVKTRVVGQKYCRGDADIFALSLKLDVEVHNISKRTVFLAPRMIPWIGRVAASPREAESGYFLYEVTQSHYPQDLKPGERVRIDPGKSVILHTDYDLTVRHVASFSYPQSISAGSFALVLVLKPEIEYSGQLAAPQAIDSLTTDPIPFEVPKGPVVVDCSE
jgi:hypothetical protein